MDDEFGRSLRFQFDIVNFISVNISGNKAFRKK